MVVSLIQKHLDASASFLLLNMAPDFSNPLGIRHLLGWGNVLKTAAVEFFFRETFTCLYFVCDPHFSFHSWLPEPWQPDLIFQAEDWKTLLWRLLPRQEENHKDADLDKKKTRRFPKCNRIARRKPIGGNTQ